MLEVASRNCCYFFGLEHDKHESGKRAASGKGSILNGSDILELLACPGRKDLKERAKHHSMEIYVEA